MYRRSSLLAKFGFKTLAKKSLEVRLCRERGQGWPLAPRLWPVGCPPFPFTSVSDLYCKGSCMLVYSHVCAHARGCPCENVQAPSTPSVHSCPSFQQLRSGDVLQAGRDHLGKRVQGPRPWQCGRGGSDGGTGFGWAPCPVWCGRRAAEREPLTTGFRALAPAYLVLGWFHGGQLVSLVIQS